MLVHVITRKGFGYRPAEENDEDCLHQVGPGRPPRRPPRAAPAKPRLWTDIFATELAAIGTARPDVVAVTAAMLHPPGWTSSRRLPGPGVRRRALPSSTP